MTNKEIEEKSKKCNWCKIVKQLNQFDKKTLNNNAKKSKLGTNYICKECQKKRNRSNYIKNNNLCKKCNGKKIQITYFDSDKIKLICRTCKPIGYMSNKDKQIYDEINNKFKNDAEFKKLSKAYGPLSPRIIFV